MDNLQKIAEDIIDKAITVRHLPKKECKTEHIPIHGHNNQYLDQNHLYIYGTDIPKIIELQNKNQN
jgi:glycerol-3-phosphate dehydrogenase